MKIYVSQKKPKSTLLVDNTRGLSGDIIIKIRKKGRYLQSTNNTNILSNIMDSIESFPTVPKKTDKSSINIDILPVFFGPNGGPGGAQCGVCREGRPL